MLSSAGVTDRVTPPVVVNSNFSMQNSAAASEPHTGKFFPLSKLSACTDATGLKTSADDANMDPDNTNFKNRDIHILLE
jgi:hypothetical protein